MLKSAADDPSGEQRAKEFTSARAANAKAARPLKDGYELVGSFPEGFDGAAAEALVSAAHYRAPLIPQISGPLAAQTPPLNSWPSGGFLR